MSGNMLQVIALTSQGETQAEIGRKLGVTRERIRQLQAELSLSIPENENLSLIVREVINIAKGLGLTRTDIALKTGVSLRKMINITRSNSMYKNATRAKYINEVLNLINDRIGEIIISIDKIAKLC